MAFKFDSNGKTHREVLDDVCSCKGHCLLKELILEGSLLGDRDLEQLKCVDIFKYEQSSEAKKNIGWKESTRRWIAEGYAEKFAQVYSPEKHYEKIYEEIMQRE